MALVKIANPIPLKKKKKIKKKFKFNCNLQSLLRHYESQAKANVAHYQQTDVIYQNFLAIKVLNYYQRLSRIKLNPFQNRLQACTHDYSNSMLEIEIIIK